MVKMAPQKTSEYEEDHTKVEEEALDDGARDGTPRGRRPRSVKGSAHSKASQFVQEGDDVLVSLRRGKPGLTIESVEGGGSIGHDDAVIMTGGPGAVLPGTEGMPNGDTPASTVTVPTTTGSTGKDQREARTPPPTSPNVSVGPTGDSFTEFLKKWIERRGITTADDYENIWDDIKAEREKLMANLKGGETDLMKQFCTEETVLIANVKIEPIQKSLCKALLKTFLYMDGINLDGKKKEEKIDEDEKEEKAFMRCMVGIVTMFQLFGDHCYFEKFMDYAYTVKESLKVLWPVGDNTKICAWMDFKQATIGSKLIGKKMAEWNKNGYQGIAGWRNIKGSDSCTDTTRELIKKGREKKKDEKDKEKIWIGEEREKELREILKGENFLSNEGAQEILEKMKKGKITWDDDLVRQVREKIEQEKREKQTEISQAREDDSTEDDLQPEQPPQEPEPPSDNVISEEEGTSKDETEKVDTKSEQDDPGASETTTPPTGDENKDKKSDDGGKDIATASLDGGANPLPSPAAPFKQQTDDPFLPYLPTIPVLMGFSAMTYLLWKYFGMLRKGRKRYKRAHQVRGPSLEQQIVDHVDHLGSREYYIVKERKPRFTPKKRRKKRAARRRAGRRGVGRRMIIDIHLEVLNECQKGGLHSTKEDFFEILVKEFMESEFIKEDFVPKEQVPGSG